MTAIVLPLTGENPTDQPVLLNYRKYFSEQPSIIGAWKFDNPADLTMVSGKVAEVANYIPGGPIWSQSTAGNRAALVYDNDLKRNVADLVRASATYYTMSGGVITPSAAWTLIMVHKPAAAQFATLGQVGPDTWLANGDTYLNGHIPGADIAATPTAATGWNRQAVAYAGSGVIKLRVGNSAVVSASGGSAPGGSGFVVGNASPAVAYGGRLDRAVLVQADLLTDLNNPVSKNVFAWLKSRGV